MGLKTALVKQNSSPALKFEKRVNSMKIGIIKEEEEENFSTAAN